MSQQSLLSKDYYAFFFFFPFCYLYFYIRDLNIYHSSFWIIFSKAQYAVWSSSPLYSFEKSPLSLLQSGQEADNSLPCLPPPIYIIINM